MCSIFVMLTVTPIAAATALVYFDPRNWGGDITFFGIIGIAVFGLLTVPVCVTYIPTLVFTPIFMNKLSKKEAFYIISKWKFFVFSIIGGSIAGIFIVLPIIVLSMNGGIKIIVNWLWAGMVAGSVTCPIIATIYRFSAFNK